MFIPGNKEINKKYIILYDGKHFILISYITKSIFILFIQIRK